MKWLPILRDRTLWFDISLLSVVAVALLVHGFSMVGDFRIDDAYITFVYSKNLAQGLGPIYSLDLKVEGYSNFLWMMLVAVGELFGASPIATARVLSCGAYGLVLFATYWGARCLGGRLPAVLVTTVLAASTDFHRLIQSGLETVLFSAFLAAGCVHYLLEDKVRRRWSLLWFSGAALTRIDGFVPLFLILGMELARVLVTNEKPEMKTLVSWVLRGTFPVALYWVWRVSYYGLLFPLPYYAKASLGMLEFNRGVDYVINVTRESGLWLAVLWSTFGLSLLRRQPTIAIAAFVAMMGGYVAYVGGDWMPLNRMAAPLFSPLLVLAAAGIGLAIEQSRQLGRIAHGVGRLSGFASCAFMAVYLNEASLDTHLERGKINQTNHIRQHTLGLLKAVPFMQAIVRSRGDKLVTDYGGVFAYGTNASVIEMWGLANREIALRGNTEGIQSVYGKTCVPCYAEFEPDYFHPFMPLVRGPNDFNTISQLIQFTFQGPAIDRVISLKKNYVMGRVRRAKTDETMWFMERKRPGVSFDAREVGEFIVDYPSPPVKSSSSAKH